MDKSPNRSLYKCASYENELNNNKIINDQSYDLCNNNSQNLQNSQETKIKNGNDVSSISVGNNKINSVKNETDYKNINNKISMAGITCSTNASSINEFNLIKDEILNSNN